MEIFPNCVDRSERIDQDLGLGMKSCIIPLTNNRATTNSITKHSPQQLGNIDEKSKT